MNHTDSARLAAAKHGASQVTAMYRVPIIVENLLRNLPLVTSLPQNGVTFSGTVVVCGAGPSLNHAIPVLRERIGKVAIVAVNTAGPALSKAGIPIDALVCIESLDLSEQIRASTTARLVVLDLSASPKNFEAAKNLGARVAWIIEANPVTAPLAYSLGVRPHQSGGFALSAALELARVGGASEIVLCGADLGYPTGQAYADGSGWTGLAVERDGERLKFTGREDRDETHASSGVPPLPRDRPLYDVPAWGGGTIPTVVEFVEQRDWIAQWAKHFGDVFNASVGGAAIAGVEAYTPEACITNGAALLATAHLYTSGDEQRHVVSPAATNAEYGRVRDAILAQCEAAKRIAAHFLDGEQWPDVEAMATYMPIPMALSSYERSIALNVEGDDGERARAGIKMHYEAIRAAAQRAERIVRGEHDR